MTSVHKPADRFHPETSPTESMNTLTICRQKMEQRPRGLSSKDCACVERGALLSDLWVSSG
jgi:hypothetical protein